MRLELRNCIMVSRIKNKQSVCIPAGLDSRSYSCVRSLSKQGIHTILASIEAEVAAGASRFCDEQIQIPSPKQNILAYRDALLDIASRRDVETILPVRPHDAYLFARYNDLFDPHVSLTTPSSDLLETVTDRLQLAAAAESADVAVPHTRLVTDVDDWSPELIVKSRFNLLVVLQSGLDFAAGTLN
ncbi:hypothetical protein SAMN05444271_1201 [Halohasta litchfieldiae]|uniref:Uncharacterized protein n=1 Tax=Halohasta litchfieldiae TaxID=1073996 RepID=A0A1H6VTZ1_9EURY|nr:hypothetical protein SAMN05444271_1201 [Halohasta litchfieldiae]